MTKKNTEKHTKKKSVPILKNTASIEVPAAIESDLPLPMSEIPAVKFSLGAQSTAEQLRPFTGLDDSALRRLERKINPDTQSPYIPPGRYSKTQKKSLRLTEATLIGVREWREHEMKSSESRLEHVSFATMELCEGATGISKTLQQLAKSKGCAAFRGPRVYLLDLVRWIFKTEAAERVDWGKMNPELDAKLKHIDLETKIGNLIERAEAEELLRHVMAIVFQGYNRMEMEFPRDFEMRPKEYIKQGVKTFKTTVIAQANATLEKLKVLADSQQTEIENVK